MRKIFISICFFCVTVYWAYAWVEEDQKYINDNFSVIEDKKIPEAARQAFNDLPSPLELPQDATFGDYRSLVGDGVPWPVTTSAIEEISSVLGADANDGFISSGDPGSVSPSPENSWQWWEQKPCEFDVDNETRTISSALDDCLRDSPLVDASSDLNLEWQGAKSAITRWTTSIAGFLALLAVGAIVYGWLLMTLSWGEDEKIKKWKDVVKWAIIWFLWVLFAWALVRIVIELVFGIASIST